MAAKINQHSSVIQSLAFAKHPRCLLPSEIYESASDTLKHVWDDRYAEPTIEDCRAFVAWHSQGKSYGTGLVNPGLHRLLIGWSSMGIATSKRTRDGDPGQAWLAAYEKGLIGFSDFFGDQYDPIITPMFLGIIEKHYHGLPTCISSQED